MEPTQFDSAVQGWNLAPFHRGDRRSQLPRWVRSATQSGAKLGFALLLALGGGMLPTLITPPAAEAYTSRLNLFLVREEGESFESFRQRSEIIARAGVQRSFDADVLMTDVIVTVIGESQGITVPVLTVAVSRRDWQLQPDVTAWVKYYDAARDLL